VPASYSVGGSYGGWFGISVDGVTLPAYATYNYNAQMVRPQVQGRVPATLVVAVALGGKPQTVVALASDCIIDSPASLSVLI
jgi:hypothetical protein